MKIELAMLTSDYLILFLVLLTLTAIYKASKNRNTRITWEKVFTRPLSMIAFVILGFYTSFALLDSLHFRVTEKRKIEEKEKIEIFHKSFFDLLIYPIGFRSEKTYSSPFAAHSYLKSVILAEDGSEKRGHAPLKYAALGIETSKDFYFDLLFRFIKGFLLGGIFAFLFVESLLFFLAKGQKNKFLKLHSFLWKEKQRIQWKWAALTFLVMTSLLSFLYQLSLGYHVLGTNQIGQDVLYEGFKSIRTGLLIGTLTTLFMLPFSIFLGTVAGYFGGKVDDVISYIYSTISSIPSVLLISASILVMQVYISNQAEMFSTLEQRADARFLMLCLVLGLTSWAHLCRLLRGETLKLRELNYIKAAQSLGVKPFTIIAKHIVPNIMHIVLITVVLDFSGLVLAEAVLSYIGVGVDPTTMSWGNMINTSRLELAREPLVWWPLLAALIFMFFLILSANIFSDAVRDAFDPKLRGEL